MNTNPPTVRPRNEVVLTGRVAAAVDERELPSGDTVINARLIVDREDSAMPWSSQRIDTIDCVAWSARVHRSMRHWKKGDQVEIAGSIRRRFFRTADRAGSRVEVEVKRTSRVK